MINLFKSNTLKILIKLINIKFNFIYSYKRKTKICITLFIRIYGKVINVFEKDLNLNIEG